MLKKIKDNDRMLGVVSSAGVENCIAEHDKQIRADERERIVKELEEAKSLVPVNRVLDDIINDKPKELGMLIAYGRAIEIVRGGENDI